MPGVPKPAFTFLLGEVYSCLLGPVTVDQPGAQIVLEPERGHLWWPGFHSVTSEVEPVTSTIS